MKSDLLNNYIVRDFNYPSVRWDGEWSNNKYKEFVECVRDVFLTQTVKKPTRKREGHTSNLLGLELVNKESIVSGTEHLSPGKSDNETLIFSLLHMCGEKQKEQEQEFKYDLSKAKGNFAQMRTEFDEFDWSCILDTSIHQCWQILKERIHDAMCV